MKKVFLIDDNKDIQGAVSDFLELEGYNVKVAQQFDALTEDAIAYNPHIILLDLLLQGNNGEDICKSLKNDSRTKHIPVVMLSAHSTAEIRAKVAGANGFLAKPFDIGVLLSTIEKHIV